MFLLEPQKEPKRVPLLPIAREARLKGNGSRVARAALRAVSLKNPRADGLAPARGQHSTIGRFVFLLFVAYFRPFVGGGVPDAPWLPLRGAINPTTVESFWPRRGQTVGRRKSVKKNAALLRFLAFPSNDLLFGVPRGRAPWAVPRASEVAGLFCFSFGHKREGLAGRSPL